MAIRSISFNDFTAFQKAELQLSPGINVLIGENATGKTHAMKALYALVAESKLEAVEQKLAEVFRPDDGVLGRLGHRRKGQKTARVKLTDDAKGFIEVSISTKTSAVTRKANKLRRPAAVFLPSREGLAMYEGFAALYRKYNLAFDATYYDLAEALSVAGLKGSLPTALSEIGSDLERALHGKVVLSGPRFYLRGEGGSMLEAPLLSEGMRKLASVLRLLQNGELRSTGLLLWDEPEANLNPKLTIVVAQALARLAQNDVQVVLATHDYLLVETLNMIARERGAPATRFFVFQRRKGKTGVEVAGADSLDDLPANPIREEYLAHYDRLRGAE